MKFIVYYQSKGHNEYYYPFGGIHSFQLFPNENHVMVHSNEGTKDSLVTNLDETYCEELRKIAVSKNIVYHLVNMNDEEEFKKKTIITTTTNPPILIDAGRFGFYSNNEEKGVFIVENDKIINFTSLNIVETPSIKEHIDKHLKQGVMEQEVNISPENVAQQLQISPAISTLTWDTNVSTSEKKNPQKKKKESQKIKTFRDIIQNTIINEYFKKYLGAEMADKIKYDEDIKSIINQYYDTVEKIVKTTNKFNYLYVFKNFLKNKLETNSITSQLTEDQRNIIINNIYKNFTQQPYIRGLSTHYKKIIKEKNLLILHPETPEMIAQPPETPEMIAQPPVIDIERERRLEEIPDGTLKKLSEEYSKMEIENGYPKIHYRIPGNEFDLHPQYFPIMNNKAFRKDRRFENPALYHMGRKLHEIPHHNTLFRKTAELKDFYQFEKHSK